MLSKLLNQKGLTLVESLLSLFLFSIIGTVVYFVLLSGLKTENKISTEGLLRDEADLVMSQIIDTLYAAPASKVKVSSENENILVYEASTPITVGFIGNEVVIDGKSISANQFDFSQSSIAKVGNSVKIILNVKRKNSMNDSEDRLLNLSLQSQFGLMEE
jgi:prepilin-type N-terminal cleavage/methylation domain-containing protein